MLFSANIVVEQGVIVAVIVTALFVEPLGVQLQNAGSSVIFGSRDASAP